MNSDLTYQIFLQSVFKSIIVYFENSDLCPANSVEEPTSNFSFSFVTDRTATLARTLTGNNSATMNMSTYKLLLENVTHFVERMVDKIWEIEYREPKQIFEFIVKIINQAKKRGVNAFLDSLYRSLNRTILFELSRKSDSIGGNFFVECYFRFFIRNYFI